MVKIFIFSSKPWQRRGREEHFQKNIDNGSRGAKVRCALSSRCQCFFENVPPSHAVVKVLMKKWRFLPWSIKLTSFCMFLHSCWMILRWFLEYTSKPWQRRGREEHFQKNIDNGSRGAHLTFAPLERNWGFFWISTPPLPRGRWQRCQIWTIFS